MAPKGITKRWMVNGVGVIVVLLVIFELAFIVSIRSYYYQSVKSVLSNRAGRVSGLLTEYVKDSAYDFEAGARAFAENFGEKEVMELQVIDAKGKPVVSSTGFASADTDMPDFNSALAGGDGVWYGKNSNGENVMAVTAVVRDSEDNVRGAVRHIVSLSRVDSHITLLVMVMLLIAVLIIFFVMLSGSFFVSSIVNPVSEIGRAARRIALGDYDYRLEKKNNDELGELCDTINYMASEIATAEKMKNEFISSVSHELRTPLTAIKGWSETLRQGGMTDEELTQKGLSVIADEADRLSGIVEELLDFSRMQSGHITMKFTRMDVLAELEEAVVLFRDRARRLNMDLQYIEAENLPFVIGDRDRLKQVFINVIDNAIKYSNEGGKIRIEAADMGNHVQIVISDSGVGISKEDLPNIKTKFYKANKTRPGSGIGLALADEIIRRHKGRIELDSVEGVGTTVTITLPVAAQDTEQYS